jgi:hypothetical protein
MAAMPLSGPLIAPLSATESLSGVTQTRKSPIPVPPIPDRFGRESGRESAEIGNREIPRFPIWPGIGNRGISRLVANREIGDAPLCEYIMHDPGLDVALSPSNADSGLPPHFSAA